MGGGALVEGVVFDDKKGKGVPRARYYEEMNEDLFHAISFFSPRITFGFYAGGAAPQIGSEFFKLARVPDMAPTAHPWHPVLEFWPAGCRPDLDPFGGKLVHDSTHPSSVWTRSRCSSRFHFKADRLADYTSFQQMELLGLFLDDVAATIAAGRETLTRAYHETLDTSAP
jgi:hypothetical protein